MAVILNFDMSFHSTSASSMGIIGVCGGIRGRSRRLTPIYQNHSTAENVVYLFGDDDERLYSQVACLLEFSRTRTNQSDSCRNYESRHYLAEEHELTEEMRARYAFIFCYRVV
jgi:hypothetical protein